MLSDAVDMWADAREDFALRVLPKLQRDGKKIGAMAAAGDENAKEVVSLYTMLHRSFDPMTFLLLKDALAKLPQTPDIKETT